MQSCIEECLRCDSSCLSILKKHCLTASNKHMEPEHVRITLACAEMCHISAAVMLIGTEHHKHTCRECAEICEACAASRERVGDMDG